MINNLKIAEIVPNPDQPRKHFDEEALKELAASIVSDGLQSPILVRPKGDGYEIVQGERRYRAHILAGLETIRAEVRELGDEDTFHLAVIENIQREQLSPIEEAKAFLRYVELGYTHEEIAKKVSKSRTFVTTRLRLLQLIPEIQDWIAQGKISEGHAKQILAMENSVCRLAEDAGNADESGLFEFLQRSFIEKYDSAERVTVNEVRDWIDQIRSYFLLALFKKFLGQGARVLNLKTGVLANEVIDMFNLRIACVKREDLEFSLEWDLKRLKAGGRRSDLYRFYEDLEDRLFAGDGEPSYPRENLDLEIRDYHDRLLIATKLWADAYVRLQEANGALKPSDDEIAEYIANDTPGIGVDMVKWQLELIREREFSEDLIEDVKLESRLKQTVSRDTAVL